MKKIFILIISLIMISNVHAIEYTPYTTFGEYTENIIQSDNLTDVKHERRYRYYKENKILGPYEKEDTINEEYPLIDKEDYTYTNESEYQTIKPEEKEGRIISEYDGIKYQKAKDITYLKLTNNSDKSIDITDFNIKYKNDIINYTLDTNNATIDKFESRGTVIIKFNQPIILSFLTISLNANSIGSTLTVETLTNEDIIISSNSYTIINNYKLNYLGLNAYILGDYEDYLDKKENNLPEGKSMKKIEEITIYTYKDIIYRKYKLEKEYYPIYLNGPYEEYINKDETDYKDFYAKRTRQIIETKPIETKTITEENKAKIPLAPLKTIPEINNPINDLSKINENLNTNDLNYYDISYNPIKKTKNNNEIELWYFIGPLLILICIFVLLLSKLYKRNKEYAKV